MAPRPAALLLLETTRPASERIPRAFFRPGNTRRVPRTRKRHEFRNLIRIRLLAGHFPRSARQPRRSPPPHEPWSEAAEHLRLHRCLFNRRSHGGGGNHHAGSFTAVSRLGEAEPFAQWNRSGGPPFLQRRHLPLAAPVCETRPALDGIVLDPPTFSRDEKGRVFRVESDYTELASLALDVLAPGGWLLCCTNFKKLPPYHFEKQLLAASSRKLEAVHAAMPPDFTGEPYLKSVWLR